MKELKGFITEKLITISLALLPAPKAVQLIHLELIARYKKIHDFDMKSLLAFINNKSLELNDMDSNYYFFLYCILYVSNTLPLIKAHYSEAIDLKFSANQQEIKSRFPLLSFYMGVDAHQTFGIGNLWPIFHDTIVPETEKNLAHIHTNYVNLKFGLDRTSFIGEDKQVFKNLQYCFLLSIEHVNPPFLVPS